MTSTPAAPPPAWWVDMQKRLGDVWTAPLADAGGRFSVDAGGYAPDVVAWVRPATTGARKGEPQAVGAQERLALYHQQMWQRWLVALQESLPRVTAVVGPWSFNRLCHAVLRRQSPSSPDLSELAGLLIPEFTRCLTALAEPLPGPTHARWETLAQLCARPGAAARVGAVPVDVLSNLQVPWVCAWQALQLDAAERHAYRSRPPQAMADAGAGVPRAWADARVRFTPSLSVLRVDSDGLVEGFADGGARRTGPLSHAQHWAVYRAPTAVVLQRMDAAAARLMALCRSQALGAAREAVVEAAAPGQRDAVAKAVLHAEAQALRLGWWEGTRADGP